MIVFTLAKIYIAWAKKNEKKVHLKKKPDFFCHKESKTQFLVQLFFFYSYT